MNEQDNFFILESKGYEEGSREYMESIFSMGNGYMGCRGFDEEDETGEYKLCTYIAGIFDYFLPETTDMVNSPNFWNTDIYVNGEKFSKYCGKLIDYNKKINMEDGIFARNVVWENSKGDRTIIETKRFLSIHNRHLGVMQISITPVNYNGSIEICTGIDGNVKNNIIEDDQMKNNDNLFTFLNSYEKEIDSNSIMKLKMKTSKSDYSICEGFGMTMYPDDCFSLESVLKEKYIGKSIKLNVNKDSSYTFQKYISVWTSRDCREDMLFERAAEDIKYCLSEGFEKLYDLNLDAWAGIWDVSDVKILGDEKTQRAIRYNIFQLVQTVCPEDPGVSIGARGIMHGRYKGCYFWDTEIFMLPFYEYTNPSAARNLLKYRYNTLDGARKNARNQNLNGARFPWMSSIDGTEQCGTWDIGFSEVHITADIAYSIDRYYMVNGDTEFMRDFGLEILIETARYWGGRFTFNEASGKYDMLFVKGPNEYGGVTINNTYTTIMALYNFKTAKKYINLIKKNYSESYEFLKEKIDFDETEVNYWDDIIQRAVILYDKEKKLYIEDENFLRTEPLELSKIKDGDMPLYRKICFDRLQRYRVLKQADVVLLMLLLPDEFSFDEKLAAWNCYEPITAHDSSLSFGTHAEAAAKLGLMDKAFKYFSKSVNFDIDDLMGNTGNEGIHFASLGASYQALLHGFCGVEIKDGYLSVDPSLPKEWSEVSFKIWYKNNLISFKMDHKDIKVELIEKGTDEINIKIKDKFINFKN